jgi:hypothetical protein
MKAISSKSDLAGPSKAEFAYAWLRIQRNSFKYVQCIYCSTLVSKGMFSSMEPELPLFRVFSLRKRTPYIKANI